MEDDLDWLARNVHVWPAGDHQPWCYVYWKGGQRSVSGNCITVIQPCVRVEMSDWLARRAELQNKPSWADAPDWAEWLAQDEDGEWKWLGSNPSKYIDGWTANKLSRCKKVGAYGAVIEKGTILCDWCDTLEKRPEQDEFETLTSIEDNQEQDMTQQQEMKQDIGWFERGELPPVGTVCLYVVSDRLSAEVEITAHAKLGLCFVQVGQSGESYVSKTAELHRFRPIRTEREVAIEEMCNVAGLDGLVFGLVAGELYDAGYRKQNLPAK